MSAENDQEGTTLKDAIQVFRRLEDENRRKGNGGASGAYWDAANFLEREVLDE